MCTVNILVNEDLLSYQVKMGDSIAAFFAAIKMMDPFQQSPIA